MIEPIPFDESIALRMKAAAAVRRARSLPPGPERNEWRHIAMAYRALSENEAWLSGVRIRRRANAVPSDGAGEPNRQQRHRR
jgi:hypothetical protein